MDLSQFVGSSLPIKIYDHYAANATDWRRPHLGASIIGKDCSRELWYSFRWAKAPNHDGRLLRLFEAGNNFENRIVPELEAIGITVTDRQRVVDIFPHFGGSIDGLGQGFEESKKVHVLEFKTHNDKSFKELSTKGVESAKPQHFIQMNIYMGALRLDRAYYIAENKNTSEIYAERVRYNATVYHETCGKAKTIIDSPRPPVRIADNPARFACKWCGYSLLCHSRDVPEVNCRTCLHSTPEAEGWTCARHGGIVPLEYSKRGCKEHLFIPDLLNRDVLGATADAVEYEGWTNKENSREYRA